MSEVELRQAYREKLYNYRPPWILRWGVTIFFLFLLIIIVSSGFIKYPDVVPATAEITTINPPSHLIAHVNGKIKDILIEEGQAVSKNDVIVVLESPTNWTDINTAYSIISVLDTFLNNIAVSSLPGSYIFNKNLVLGELQGAFSDMVMKYNELNIYYNLGYFEEELSVIRKKLNTQKEYQSKLIIKKKLLESQFEISNNKFARDSLMYIKGGISKSELERSRQNILQFKTTLTDMDMAVINGRSTLNQLNYEIESLIVKNKVNSQQLHDKLRQSMQLLKSRIDTWKQNYILVAPISGIVSFTSFWSITQNVKVGEVVVSVVPKDSMQVKVRLQFPIQNSGKVKVGQRVIIKLQNYPYQEFGMLTGKLSNISKVPNNLFYSADVILENGLITSYGKKLPMVQQIIGNAEIMTDNLSLLLRFFNPLRAIFEERT